MNVASWSIALGVLWNDVLGVIWACRTLTDIAAASTATNVGAMWLTFADDASVNIFVSVWADVSGTYENETRQYQFLANLRAMKLISMHERISRTSATVAGNWIRHVD